ncbi:putative Fatty acyl-CoA synthetase A [Paratrimastix pyriformis]|uniref:Fatty acyl-CoA synthetase A n=1 Tax=Paratrimastix pyriformis TaxID=342808 RepID=A0ABQ8UKW5_9EUKA|nr:putative Fatty acyl-CoA synthetase A [Paratrimastix pyriformis]
MEPQSPDAGLASSYTISCPPGTYDEGVLHHTLATVFRQWQTSSPTANFLGERSFLADGQRGNYEWITYDEAGKIVTNIGSGLRSLGIAPGDRVAIMSKNRTEWMLADLACFCYGFISVPVYDSYFPTDCEYILQHSESRAVFVARENLDFINRVKATCSQLQYVILMDRRASDKEFAGGHHDLITHTMTEVAAIGAGQPLPDEAVTQDTMATFVYTSGTTGSPKGAMLTHRNMIYGVYGLGSRLSHVPFQDAHIGYLPLAHIFERVVELLVVSRAGAVGYSQGAHCCPSRPPRLTLGGAGLGAGQDVSKLVDDIRVLRPTMLPGVPRVFNKTYAALRAASMWAMCAAGGLEVGCGSFRVAAWDGAGRWGVQTESGFFLKRWAFNLAYRHKDRALDKGQETPRTDRLIFNKIRERFGGRIRLIFSGSAPLPPEVARYLRVVFGCPVVEGYALTETSSSAAVTSTDNVTYGNVGFALPGIEIKLMDLPEMGYLVQDTPPRGEICLRGPAVFQGYYKDPATTASVLRDGWVHSGDVGTYVMGNRLKIIDRVKNIFKLSQGEFVAADRVESIYSASPLVSQVMVHGERTMNGLVGLVVPNPDGVAHWCQTNGQDPALAQDRAAMARHAGLKEAIVKDLAARGAAAQLRRFEILQDILVLGQEFTTENHQMTPSFKLRREAIRRAYATELAQLCSSMRPGSSKVPEKPLFS